MEDRTGKEDVGCRKLKSSYRELERSIQMTTKDVKQEASIDALVRFDYNLDFDQMVAFSLLRVKVDRHARLLNARENQIIVKKAGGVHTLSKQLSQGKLGAFKIIYHDEEERKKNLAPREFLLEVGDKILLFTDEVTDLLENGDDEKRLRHIETLFRRKSEIKIKNRV